MVHPGDQTPGQLAGSILPLRKSYEGSLSMVVLHFCPGLGVSYKQRVEDAVFQPHEDMAVPTAP